MDADLVSKPISQILREAPAIGPTPASDDVYFKWTLQAASTPGNSGLQQVIQRLVVRFGITQSHQAVAALKKTKKLRSA